MMSRQSQTADLRGRLTGVPAARWAKITAVLVLVPSRSSVDTPFSRAVTALGLPGDRVAAAEPHDPGHGAPAPAEPPGGATRGPR